MRIAFFIACVMLNNVGYSVASDDARNDEESLGFYTNMGVMCFIYVGELFEELECKEERLGVARNASYMMFAYWAETRHGDIPPSIVIDSAIHKSYKAYFSQDERLSNLDVFSDPLDWLESDKPKWSLPPNAIRSVNKREYKTLLLQYRRFLDGVDLAPIHRHEGDD